MRSGRIVFALEVIVRAWFRRKRAAAFVASSFQAPYCSMRTEFEGRLPAGPGCRLR